ncbi:MAG: glutathione synthase [Burkholderiaceae bacterium]|nr:glutathione synthase [Burkholderiaceae bacterium]
MNLLPHMSLSLLFVADPVESFKAYKDSTYVMMREAQRRGHRVAVCEPRHLAWQSGQPVTATVRHIHLLDIAPQAGATHAQQPWFKEVNAPAATHPGAALLPPGRLALSDFDAVLMRKDPPFDAEFIYATHLLEQAEREGAKVFNRPAALRDHPEKLALMQFAQYAPPTLVTRSAADVKAFHAEHGDIILKPLDGMGGMGIFRVKADGLNLGAIIETLNLDGAQTLMVQRYLPEITDGDKRVLVIGGQAVPFSLARIPQGSEVRGNLAVGGKGVAMPITERERDIAEALGPTLAARGLMLVGLDVIGGCLTEVNVTSPTCFQEITQQTGFDVAAMFVDALEAAVAA